MSKVQRGLEILFGTCYAPTFLHTSIVFDINLLGGCVINVVNVEIAPFTTLYPSFPTLFFNTLIGGW